MISSDIIMIGGGAAGMFASVVLSEEAPELKVIVLDKESKPLEKVRVSGGGRCNLTHQCSDIREFVKNYPRGGRELIGPFNRFGPAETIEWFTSRGVPLVTLDDGCLFPSSNTSEDVIRVLLKTTAEVRTHAEVGSVQKTEVGFEVRLNPPRPSLRSGHPSRGGDLFKSPPREGCPKGGVGSDEDRLTCKKLLVATGGGGAFVEGLDHTIEPCVPSLFTFKTSGQEFTSLAGIVVKNIRVSVPGVKADGALLITHNGVSGPAILSLSSFGARRLAETNYCFGMTINWFPEQSEDEVFQTFETFRDLSPRKQIGTGSPVDLPSRLWKLLVARAGVDERREWGMCPSKALRHIAAHVSRFVLPITGKNPHREEFVTCGGIRLKEVNFKTMESRRHPGLYFAGEVLDMDALTGGFNLQAAWTTGYLAAQAMAGRFA